MSLHLMNFFEQFSQGMDHTKKDDDPLSYVDPNTRMKYIDFCFSFKRTKALDICGFSTMELREFWGNPYILQQVINHNHAWWAGSEDTDTGHSNVYEKRIAFLKEEIKRIVSDDPDIWTEELLAEVGMKRSYQSTKEKSQ